MEITAVRLVFDFEDKLWRGVLLVSAKGAGRGAHAIVLIRLGGTIVVVVVVIVGVSFLINTGDRVLDCLL